MLGLRRVLTMVAACVAAVGMTTASAGASPVGTVTGFSAGITFGSTVQMIALGPDGNMWFTENNVSKIGRITPSGVVTEFSTGITPGSGLYAITAGADGNMWFTETSGNRIGRITPSGVVTEFSAGITASSTPFNLTAGPDGNMWFTEYTGNRVGRITPSGVVTEFSAGITPGSGPVGIARGPDGNLWFTESSGQRIARITPSGVVTEFSSGITPLSYPQGITAGADGNLWFTENNVSKIGRITPTGTVTEFPLSPNTGPLWIAAGPDGNVWFTEYDSTRNIGRITPAGVVTEFVAGTTPNSYPTGIAAGPDGGMWFTESAVDTIGRITAVEQVLPPPPATAPAAACGMPAVTAISPAAGSDGTEVTIAGSGFGCATGVMFGDAPALGFSIDSAGQITARAPAHAAGNVDVRVLTTAGASPTSLGDVFTFTVPASLTPMAPMAPTAAIAPGAPRVLTCHRMPRLIGHTLAQARRMLARADCSVRVTVTGRGARRGHRTITSQTPKSDGALYAGDRAPTVRFG